MAKPVPTISPKKPKSIPNEIQLGLWVAAISGAEEVPPMLAVIATSAVNKSNLNIFENKAHIANITINIITHNTRNPGACVHCFKSEYDAVTHIQA